MVNILLKQGVVGRYHWKLKPTPQRYTGIVGGKGGVDMNKVKGFSGKLRCQGDQVPVAHHAILRVAGYLARADAQYARFVYLAHRIIGADQHDRVAQTLKGPAKTGDGGGNTINAGKVDIRNHQYLHTAQRRLGR